MVKPEELKVGQVVKVQYFFAHEPNIMRIDELTACDDEPPFAVSGVFLTNDGEIDRRFKYTKRTTSVRTVISIIKQPEEAQP